MRNVDVCAATASLGLHDVVTLRREHVNLLDEPRRNRLVVGRHHPPGHQVPRPTCGQRENTIALETSIKHYGNM